MRTIHLTFLGLWLLTRVSIAEPLIEDLELSNGTVRVMSQSLSGRVYQLQYRANLMSGRWYSTPALGPNNLSTTSNVVLHDYGCASSAQRFYRVVKSSSAGRGVPTAADPSLVCLPTAGVFEPGVALEKYVVQIGGAWGESVLCFTPFLAGQTEVTAAQYCRFLNAWKDKFPVKLDPACAITNVMNSAQGGPWVQAHVPDEWQFCRIRQTALSDYGNAYSKIKWESTSSNYAFNAAGSETNEPMTEVSWYGALAYCQWLNETEFGNAIADWKYRLPTEWEFEFLMGAREYQIDGPVVDWGTNRFAYGQCHDLLSRTNDSPDFVNSRGDPISCIGTVPVGTAGGPGKNATNVFGMFELSGNALEWCIDAHDNYPSGTNFVARGTSESSRMTKGGSWGSIEYCSEVIYRASSSMPYLITGGGFRVVRER